VVKNVLLGNIVRPVEIWRNAVFIARLGTFVILCGGLSGGGASIPLN
jgi:hypothetical protein